MTMNKKGVVRKPYFGIVEGGNKPTASAPRRQPSNSPSTEKGNKPVASVPRRSK